MVKEGYIRTVPKFEVKPRTLSKMADFDDAIYSEQDEEDALNTSFPPPPVPDPVVIRGAGNVTVLVLI